MFVHIKQTILAHGIYLNKEELEIIKERKATISHCPSSNILLQSGICPVSQYLNMGINVSLGTDCSGGNSCSMLECIRQTIMLSIQASFNKIGQKLSIEEVFYMATLGGATGLPTHNFFFFFFETLRKIMLNLFLFQLSA